MGFFCGIVGLPNVGKSTLFNTLTRASVAAENYPFCTIEPNIGRVAVPDPRLDQISAIVKPKNIIPAFVQLVDIAGLVSGASDGAGLGNKFLSHIRECDAILQVVRCFPDPNVVHVSGKIDPLADIETINTELMLADLVVIERALENNRKKIQRGDKQAHLFEILFQELAEHLNKQKSIRSFPLTFQQEEMIAPFHFLTKKPLLYLANIDENKQHNEQLQSLQTIASEENTSVITLSVQLEEEMASMNSEDQNLFLEELGLEELGLSKVIRACYKLLGLQSFFTAGPNEVRAWTIPKGTCAPAAAGIIHSDFERGFIRAEITSFQHYIQYQGEQGVKQAGKWRLEGKEYVVEDGDIILVRFNV